MATGDYAQTIIAVFGGGLSGQAANVRYSIYDRANTLKLGPTLGTLTEDTDDNGDATSGTYVGSDTFNALWLYPLRLKATISGQPGVVYTVPIGTEFAALAALVLAPATGFNINPAQVIPTGGAAESHGDCLIAARATGFGKKVRNPLSVPATLQLYAADGVTVLRTFNLDDPVSPLSVS